MITIGIDVSKDKLDLLWLKELTTRKVKTKVFKNTAQGHQELVHWVLKNTQSELDDIRFVMEATGIYHEALAYSLFAQQTHVVVVNPARIKTHAKSLGIRGKTDKKDSFAIAHYGATMPLQSWQPEPTEVRELKALIARYQALEKDLQRELNRLEKASITQVSEIVSSSITEMVSTLTHQKKLLEKEINQHIDKHPGLKKDRHLLESIPGVGPVISSLMLSVIRSRKFDGARQCSAFLGLNPVEYTSGKSVYKAPRMSKMGDGKIRAKLYMAAIVSIRYNPDIQAQYERLLKNGKCKMSAIGAAMRKLVQICFGVLKHQEEYQPQCAQ